MSLLQNSNAISAGGAYNITDSLRFRSSASAYLNRTPTTASNRKTWTWSGWVKRGALAIDGSLFDAANNDQFRFRDDNTLSFSFNNTLAIQTTQLFRDPSAWYHFVLAVDTTQATASNRIKLYINGTQVTAFSTASYPSQNLDGFINSANAHNIGRVGSGAYYFDGYMTEINFVDGQALTPSNFGEYNTDGVWSPKKYTGTYGTNGFYLNFSDGTSTTTLGYDYSGNSNNWTTNNVSLTAGTTYDLMSDVPSLADEDTGNFCTLNPLTKWSNVTLANANLEVTNVSSGGGNGGVAGTHVMTSGKWYWEFTSNHQYSAVGIALADEQFPTTGFTTDQWVYYGYNGNKYANSSSSTGYGTTFGSGDVIGIAFDADAGTLVMYKNNTSQGTLATGLTAVHGYVPFFCSADGGTGGKFNFGQRPFAYTPPTGYKKLNTFNLPDSSITDGSDYFITNTFTGTGATLSINTGFSPDFVWLKSRSFADQNLLYDTVRGANQRLYSSLTNAEATTTNQLNSFDSDGYTLGSDPSGQINVSGQTSVGWSWRGSDSAPVSNTNGTITSTVSVNTTSGFSVVTYTGTGANATVGHGLGVAPKMIICKSRTNAYEWIVWHTGLTSGAYYLNLNGTVAQTSAPTLFQSTIPSSSVITLGTNITVNASGASQLIYAFAEIAGFSKFGSYTGNGSTDGPMIFTGFKPAFVMTKRTDSSTNGFWNIYDSSRNGYNDNNDVLYPNSSSGEDNVTHIDLLSNGFKLRNATYPNTSGGTYIYAAFAENPFKNSLAR